MVTSGRRLADASCPWAAALPVSTSAQSVAPLLTNWFNTFRTMAMRGKEPRASRRYEGFFEIVFPASAKYPAQASVLGTVKLVVIVAADVVGDKPDRWTRRLLV